MRPVSSFHVAPALPASLDRLRKLAWNVRWAWNHDTIELFRRLDSELWESSGHNPVRMLGSISQARLSEASEDEAFLAHLDRAARALDQYLGSHSDWFHRTHKTSGDAVVAYFSAEFGVTECLSVFAGGLGMLAGDHLKSASDLGVPLVGVGLLYQQGYFRQYLNSSGWQQESYEDNDFFNLPLTLERDPAGAPRFITVRLGDHPVVAHIWRVEVGRIPLYLLDTNLEENRPEDRDITDQLYGGDLDMRIRQEILLGIGGFRALAALGIRPSVFHMNEGHSAFLALERVRQLETEHGLSFEEARELASAGLVFTTHTPVEAGQDYFPASLMARYFEEYARSLGIAWRQFLGLGRQNPANDSEDFCMTVLALRTAASANGVSKLHGEVSRQMWRNLWPNVPLKEIPIGHVTNGVHFRSWISAEMNQLYDRYLGPQWREEPADATVWKRVEKIPPEELWRTHERRRERLVAFARHHLQDELKRRGAPQSELEGASEALSPDCLTIGFARRFATYKRATLLLRNPERLARILNDPKRPVQLIFAGKAHPKDDAGKDLIRQIVDLARRPEFRRRVVFLENYGTAVARYLVQGVDVWLNTPLRPLEASGTSGMKALANGVLNASVLDGWWDEAWRSAPSGLVGWAIGNGEDYKDRGYQDHVEAEALYDLLERDIVPAFYERRADDIPMQWVTRMKASLASLCPEFNTHRMVRQYVQDFYLSAHGRTVALSAESARGARELSAWLKQVESAWPNVSVGAVEAELPSAPQVGDKFRVRARVRLGSLNESDVAAELCLGRIGADGELVDPVYSPMQPAGREADGVQVYEAVDVSCDVGGQIGYTVRVLPNHAARMNKLRPNLIAWAR
ncbi:MAG: alpha-glucan family phosphorylase [Acidobacteria bacterium]|nr:alpha-glucan family phosphorylase [Acidobacteriota bacterium]